MTLAMAVNGALLQSLWQGAVVALVLSIALVVLREARSRYAACCLALAALTVWPIVTGWSLYGQRSGNAATLFRFAQAIDFERWALPVWLVGVAICSLRLVLGYRRVSELRASARPADDPLKAAFARMGGRTRLAVSALVDVPSVVGYWRPIVLMPAASLAGLSTQHLEAILAHEVAHLRRGDHWVNMIQCWIEVVMFYHPAAWWISSRIRQEREHCCDDAAVLACGDASAYARALWTLEKLRTEAAPVALAGNGGSLLDRIARLTGAPREGAPLLPGVIALAFVLAFLPRTVREVSTPAPAAPRVPAMQVPVAPAPSAPKPIAPVPMRTPLLAEVIPSEPEPVEAIEEAAVTDAAERTIGGIKFEDIPEIKRAAILASLPNLIGKPYTGGVAETVQMAVTDIVPEATHVLLQPRTVGKVTIVVRPAPPPSRSTQAINAMYQDEPRVPTGRLTGTGILELDAEIAQTQYWAGWESGYVIFRLKDKAADLEQAALDLSKLSQNVTGDAEAEARLRAALKRLEDVVEEYRQRRIAIEGKDQRPTSYPPQRAL